MSAEKVRGDIGCLAYLLVVMWLVTVFADSCKHTMVMSKLDRIEAQCGQK